MLDVFEKDGVATVRLHNRPDISKEVGARCARQMTVFLLENVFISGTPYSGLMLDVRLGPAVFGPKTRESLARLLHRAFSIGLRLAIVVGDAAIQRLQFTSMCREYAPGITLITHAPSDAYQWMSGEVG